MFIVMTMDAEVEYGEMEVLYLSYSDVWICMIIVVNADEKKELLWLRVYILW